MQFDSFRAIKEFARAWAACNNSGICSVFCRHEVSMEMIAYLTQQLFYLHADQKFISNQIMNILTWTIKL